MAANPASSNVQSQHSQGANPGKWRPRANEMRYERFGETIRFLTLAELGHFFDAIDRYEHKLLFRLAYEMGCRVGELVRIQVKHLDVLNAGVFIPAENTKTRQRRTSFVSRGLMNELADWLRRRKLLRREGGALRHGEVFLFRSRVRPRGHISENRVRQSFLDYARRAGLDREYGRDTRGRALHQLTVHSLRHSHVIHHIHTHKVPIPVVQKQVGHKTLQATMVYCRPSLEMVREAYHAVRADGKAGVAPPSLGTTSGEPL